VAAGLVPWQAVEYEFTLLDTPGSALAARRYRDLAPPDSQSALYGLWRPLAGGEFWHGLRAALAVAGIPVEAMHGEFGAGCHEVIVEPAAGVMAADHAVLLRAIVKAHAARHGLTATFMARWSGAAPGHSGHVHFSLRDPAGRPLLEPGAQPGEWHAPARHVIGGLQRWLPEMALLLLPNVNSFRRLSASAWSFDPRWCLWGEDNRTTALRLLRGAPGQAHIEVRIPGADANPYLALGAVLGAAWRGMEERAEPTAPITGNAFRSNRSWPEHLRLPQTFTEAIDRFAASALVTELFGGEFQRVFAETRRAQEHESRDAVSEWELRRFLE
jgi:glutamine synthetase